MEEIEINVNNNLIRLKKWLNFEISSTVLFFFGWVWVTSLFGAVLAAVIFIPFMLKILYEEKKYGWIITFCILVFLPLLGLLFIENGNFNYQYILGGLILAMFYFYCFMLRLAVIDWTRP